MGNWEAKNKKNGTTWMHLFKIMNDMVSLLTWGLPSLGDDQFRLYNPNMYTLILRRDQDGLTLVIDQGRIAEGSNIMDHITPSISVGSLVTCFIQVLPPPPPTMDYIEKLSYTSFKFWKGGKTLSHESWGQVNKRYKYVTE